jgi:hypothetical protein
VIIEPTDTTSAFKSTIRTTALLPFALTIASSIPHPLYPPPTPAQ